MPSSSLTSSEGFLKDFVSEGDRIDLSLGFPINNIISRIQQTKSEKAIERDSNAGKGEKQ